MSLLAAYYDAQNQEAQARAGLFGAQARQAQAETSEIGLNAAAQRDEQASRGQLNRASAQKQTSEAEQVAPDAAAQRALQGAQTGLVGTQAALAPGNAASEQALQGAQANSFGTNSGFGSSFDPTKRVAGFETGTDSVAPGKGKPGPTDTVPAMLTPGEGVLNKGAMEHYGTDVIDHMNKMGLLRMGAQSEAAAAMGLPDPHAAPAAAAGGKAAPKQAKSAGKSSTPSGATPGYAMGTSDVKAAPTTGAGAPRSGGDRTPARGAQGSSPEVWPWNVAPGAAWKDGATPVMAAPLPTLTPQVMPAGYGLGLMHGRAGL